MLNIDWTNSFDSTNALMGMYLWLLFGFLSATLNCDLQRILKNNPFALHVFGVVAFFFLFAIVEKKGSASLGTLWIKTLFLYTLFVLATKSKAIFVLPVILLLLVDQSLKAHLEYEKRAQPTKAAELTVQVNQWSTLINRLIIIIVLMGVVHYAILQKSEYKEAFSWITFFFGVKQCKATFPKYSL